MIEFERVWWWCVCVCGQQNKGCALCCVVSVLSPAASLLCCYLRGGSVAVQGAEEQKQSFRGGTHWAEMFHSQLSLWNERGVFVSLLSGRQLVLVVAADTCCPVALMRRDTGSTVDKNAVPKERVVWRRCKAVWIFPKQHTLEVL